MDGNEFSDCKCIEGNAVDGARSQWAYGFIFYSRWSWAFDEARSRRGCLCAAGISAECKHRDRLAIVDLHCDLCDTENLGLRGDSADGLSGRGCFDPCARWVFAVRDGL